MGRKRLRVPAGGRTAIAAAVAFSWAAGVGGCTVGPDFQAPQPPAAKTYAGPGDGAAPSDQKLAMGQAIDDRWWSRFGSKALNDLVVHAIAGSNDLAAAKARVAQVEEQVAAAEGALLPQASLGAAVGRQKYGVTMFGPLDISIPPYTYYSAGPSLSIPLDLFGGGRRAVEENKARAEYQHDEFDAAYLSLATNVAAQAFALASLREQVAAMQAIVADDKRNVALMQTAVDDGTAPRSQLLEMQGQLAQDENLLPELEKQAAASRHGLAVLVGENPAVWTPPDLVLADFVLPAEIPASLPSELVHRRPDIRAAEAQLHAASAAIGVATADLYPKLGITASFALQSLVPGNFFNTSGSAWNAAASLTQPLLDGGQLSANRRAAIDGYQAALAEYKQVVLASFGDVADRLQTVASDAGAFRAQSDGAAAALTARDLARQAYAEGYANIFDELAAERHASEAQIALARAHAQRLIDTAALFMALGGAAPSDAAPAREAAEENLASRQSRGAGDESGGKEQF